MDNKQDDNSLLGAESVHTTVTQEVTVPRRQDSPPRKPRRNYDSPPTIALRRGFSFDATPQLPVRAEETTEPAGPPEAKPPGKTLSTDSGLSLAECMRKKYLAGANRASAA